MTGPHAVITGAASGIGLATARRLLVEGHPVLAVDRDPAGPDRLDSGRVSWLVADVARDEDRDAVVNAAKGCRYLVAAGIILLKPILDVASAELRRVFGVNVEPFWDLTSRIGRRMASGGAIVNLSSSSAKLASTTEAAVYASSKAAVLSITRSFAHAFASSNVRVNAVWPGVIDTPMQETVLQSVAAARGTTVQELSRARNATVPLGRPGSADECASVIWFLLSDQASYMTGQAVNVTGGLVTW